MPMRLRRNVFARVWVLLGLPRIFHFPPPVAQGNGIAAFVWSGYSPSLTPTSELLASAAVC
jgi:hypothetical protein